MVQTGSSGIMKLGPLFAFFFRFRLPTFRRAPDYRLAGVPGLVGLGVTVPIDRPNPPLVEERKLVRLVLVSAPRRVGFFRLLDPDPLFLGGGGPWCSPLASLGVVRARYSPAALLRFFRFLGRDSGVFLLSDW